MKIGVITGRDIMPQLDQMMESGIPFTNMDTGEPLSTIRSQCAERKRLFGAFPIAEALGAARAS